MGHVVRWGASLSSEGAPSSEKRFFVKMAPSEQYAPRRSLAATWVLRSGADADDERLDVFFRMHTNSNLD